MPLQMIEQTSPDINNALTTSQEMANDLRELYDLPQLPPIKEDVVVKSTDIITNLKGFLKDYADSEENPIDAIKFIRESIS
jgi:hypothetical protein